MTAAQLTGAASNSPIPQLDLPCAHGGPVVRAVMRLAPEDFVVREWLGFGADGAGDHWLLTVRKRAANTHWVAKQLGRLANVHPRDVGYAGLKDRHAAAEQAFTVPVRSAVSDWIGVRGEGFEVIAAQRHRRKLKRGALRGNEFVILLRDVAGDLDALKARIACIGREGIPNYFGPQRFGRDGGNLALAHRWFASGVAPADRMDRSFALSAARAYIFNAVLAERVRAGTWARLAPGDIANLDGSGSIFPVTEVDAALEERCSILDVHPTGPLWGKSTTAAHGAVAALERDIVARNPLLGAGLSAAALDQERRPLRVRVSRLEWTHESADVRLTFRLARGAFATAVLHEVVSGAFDVDGTED